MSNSREESPDWLRCFQVPTHSALTLSSDSNSSLNGSPSREDRVDHGEPSLCKSSQFLERDKNHDIVFGESGAESPSNKISKVKSLKKRLKVDRASPKKRKVVDRKKGEGDGADEQAGEEVTSQEHQEVHAPNHSVWALSSDSESGPVYSPKEEDKTSQFKETGMGKDPVLIVSGRESPLRKASKEKSPKEGPKVDGYKPKKEKNVNDNVQGKGYVGDMEVSEEEISEKHIEPHVSTSRLPLVLSEKVHRSKALVECGGESIELSGDMGAVGRIVIPDTASGNHEMYLDLKGTIYKTTIVPSRTFCVVSFGQSEAKIEAIMNDFIQLKPQSNVYEAETMVEGTLDGFSFDSEDEADKMPKAISHQIDQNDGIEEQTKGKIQKTSGLVRKRGKTAGGKPQAPKKVQKKTQVSKKAKTKK